MSYEQLIFIIRLLQLPQAQYIKEREGLRGRVGGMSTRCIQWIIAYMVDNADGEIGGTDALSLYLGFNRQYYSQTVKKMILRCLEVS